MADLSVKQLAIEVGTPVDRLVQQFKDAGLEKNADAMVSEQEKQLWWNI
jgi:bacterial translation initiation factor 2 (bIF-2)